MQGPLWRGVLAAGALVLGRHGSAAALSVVTVLACCSCSLRADYVEVPVASDSFRKMSVTALINGRKAMLLVDTAATFTTIDRERTRDITGDKLVASENTVAGIGGSNFLRVTKFTADTFRVGHASATNMTVDVLDFSAINARRTSNGLKPMDGVLGVDFLKKYGAQIDYDRMTLKIRR